MECPGQGRPLGVKTSDLDPEVRALQGFFGVEALHKLMFVLLTYLLTQRPQSFETAEVIL